MEKIAEMKMDISEEAKKNFDKEEYMQMLEEKIQKQKELNIYK